jgi:hypothetical protein
MLCRPPGYRKNHNFSNITAQAKNPSDRHEVWMFEWSPRRRKCVHRATIGIQGEEDILWSNQV